MWFNDDRSCAYLVNVKPRITSFCVKATWNCKSSFTPSSLSSKRTWFQQSVSMCNILTVEKSRKKRVQEPEMHRTGNVTDGKFTKTDERTNRQAWRRNCLSREAIDCMLSKNEERGEAGRVKGHQHPLPVGTHPPLSQVRPTAADCALILKLHTYISTVCVFLYVCVWKRPARIYMTISWQ